MKPLIFTKAFDLLCKILAAPCTITKEVERKEVHATVNGLRSVVAFDGQLYEILVNPMHQFVETFEERKQAHEVSHV